MNKVVKLWETYLTKYPQIHAALFHNDDMALAASKVMKAPAATEIALGGVDAMPPAIQAVIDGRWPRRCATRPAASMGRRGDRRGRVTGEKRRYPEVHPDRRPGGHQGQRARHAVDAGSFPDLSPIPEMQ